MSARLGYSVTWELLRYLNNRRKLSKNKVKLYRDFLKDKSEMLSEIDTRMAEIRLHKNKPSISEVKEKTFKSEELGEVHILKNLLEAVSILCDAADPILKHLLNESNPETRQSFRENIKFFPLSNKVHEFEKLLNNMCSEKSMEVGNES